MKIEETKVALRLVSFILVCALSILVWRGAGGLPERDSVQAGGPLFAVIPTIGIGGPLAILAILFPSVFGGVLLLFRKWAAFLAVLTVQSAMLFFHSFFATAVVGTWWGSPASLWLALTLATVLGLLWAWRRSLPRRQGEVLPSFVPQRSEHIVLWVLSLSCVVVTGYYFLDPPLEMSLLWRLIFSLFFGVWAATIYALGHAGWAWVRSSQTASSSALTYQFNPLPTEGVILCAMLAPLFFFLSQMAAPQGLTVEVTASSEGLPAAKFVRQKSLNVAWKDNLGGMILSSPVVHGNRLYFAAAHQTGGANLGVVYCVDRRSGKVFWTFDDDGLMKQVFSSPRIADGKLFIGEGFHFDPDCKLYCLDAKSGEKRWDFQTTSQTESTPYVSGNTVYFGAGNDGVIALNATSGKLIWNYRPEGKIFRAGAGPVARGDLVWFGSGIDRVQPARCQTAVVCANAKTGKEVWKVATDLPNWADAVVAGEQVFFGLGNGDLFTDDDVSPAGALLCLDALTGAKQWRFDVGNGVHSRPTVDARHVYFGSRDGYVYCVNRFSGKIHWKRHLGSPVIAAPVLDQGEGNGRAVNVFVVAVRGQVHCLDAATGKFHWSNDRLLRDLPAAVATPALLSTPTARGTRRRIYFGTAIYNLTLPRVYYFEDLLPANNPVKSGPTSSQ